MSILRLRDKNGNVTDVPALVGPSAYDIAVKHGFVGTEKDFWQVLQNRTVRCSEIGMTPSDRKQNNFLLLCDALSWADTIVVDGMYKLSASVAYPIDKNIRFVGIGKDCGFDLSDADGNMFEVLENCSQITLEDLMLTGSDDKLVTVFHKSRETVSRMNSVQMIGCHLSGNISPFRFYQSITVNPEDTTIGIDTVSICNNTFQNVRESCFWFSDVMFDTFEVVGNVVQNFDNVFVWSGTTNATDEASQMIADAINRNKKQYVIRENEVICDDEWFHDAESSGSYYAFVVAEGVDAYYGHNKVIGMKSMTEVALYDAYLSCGNVVSEYNYWKNNCALIKASNNQLMKAKENGNMGVGKRTYRNNTYIVEKEFYEKYGVDAIVSDIYVRMVANESPNVWDIQNNDIDVYHLAGFGNSSNVSGMTLKGNTIRTHLWHGSALLAGVEETEVICEDNRILCDDGTAFNGLNTENASAEREKVEKYIFRNNLLKNCRYPLGTGYAKELIISGNTFIDSQNTDCMMSAYAEYDSVIGYNNKIDKKNGYFSVFNGSPIESVDYTVDSVTSGAFENRPFMTLLDGMNYDLMMEFEGDAIDSADCTPFRGRLIISISQGNVGYYDENGEQVIKRKNSGEYTKLPMTMILGDALPFDVYLDMTNNQLVTKNMTDRKIVMQSKILTLRHCSMYIPDDAGLPSEYQQVLYIESSGSQYIDTGVNASEYADGISYSFDGVITSHAADTYLFGALANSSRSANITVGAAGVLSIACGGNSKSLGSFSFKVGEYLNYTVLNATSAVPNGFTHYLNGVEGEKFSDSLATASDMPNVNIYFLKCNGSSRTGASCKVYRFTMRKADGTPIRSFIPCYRTSDGAIGLYDIETETFFENAGSGAFVKGNDV